MYGKKNILVTTTSNLQNYEINRYLGLVSARVVAGTGFLSDFIASFSDTFGGRSGTYQRQLTKINEEAIEILKEDASRRGANAVIGVRIDHDEISGKTKQMFMVTAMGTAVVVSKDEKATDSISGEKAIIDSDTLKIELKKNDLIKTIKSETLKMPTQESWDFLIENRVHEVAYDLLERVDARLTKGGSIIETYNKNLTELFINLSPELSIDILYSYFEKAEKLGQFCLETIRKLNLLDLDRIEQMLHSDDFYYRKVALYLMKCDKEFYTKNDIIKLDSIRDLVANSFPDVGKCIENDKWLCKCGKKNKVRTIYCKSCKKNIKGFEESETKHESILLLIDGQIEALKALLY